MDKPDFEGIAKRVLEKPELLDSDVLSALLRRAYNEGFLAGVEDEAKHGPERNRLIDAANKEAQP